ncbi:plasmid recombination protein, partial [Salmonella enterica]
PHLHAIITPIISDKNNNRLSMKEFLGGKKLLSELQTDYAKSMEKFGLSRGIEKSVAKHQDIKTFYSSIEDAKEIGQETKEEFKKDFKVAINIKTPTPTGRIFKTITPEEAKKSTIENLQEYKKKVNEKIHPMHDGIVNLSIENKRLQTENTQLREVAARLNRDNEISRKRDQKFDHMRKLCPDEYNQLQKAYKNRLNEIEQKKKQDEELKLKQKLELEQKRKEELAKRPKGESSLDLDEQRKNKMKPEPEPQQQIEYSRPRPRF